MDLTFTAAEEQFRTELRAWLARQHPGRVARPGVLGRLDDDESFELRRDWERARTRPASPASVATEYGGRGGRRA